MKKTTIERITAKNAKYWKDRALKQEAGIDNLSRKTSKDIAKLYKRSYQKLTKEIDSLYAEIMDGSMEDVTRTQLYQLEHYVRLRDAVARECRGLAKDQDRFLTALLDHITTDTMKGTLKEFGIDFSLLNKYQAKAIVGENWSGIKYSDRIWKNAEAMGARVMDDIEGLIVAGKHPSDVKKQLMKDYGVGWNESDRLVRTESSRAYNKAAMDSYTTAGIDQCEYLAEADCCDICAHYKGKKFPIREFPELPMHPNCRCTVVPIVEGFR